MRTTPVLLPVMLCLLGMPAMTACDDQDVPPPTPSVVTDEPVPPPPSYPDPPVTDAPYVPEADLPDDPVPTPAPESEPEATDDCAYVGDYTRDTGESPYGPGGPVGCAFPGDVKCTVTVPGPLLPDW